MAKDVFDLLRRYGRRLGEVAVNPFGPGFDGHEGRQMIERLLPNEVDHVFGGVELG